MLDAVLRWVEVVFDAVYLLVIWTLVIVMARRRPRIAAADRTVADCFTAAFALLALGDTFHLSLRILSHLKGSLSTTHTVLGYPVTIGLGALATGITLTFFYMLFLKAWRWRFAGGYGWFGYILFGAAAVRLLLFLHPANNWNSPFAPLAWSIYRNIPLFLQGLGVAFLIWRDAVRTKDRAFLAIAGLIVVSYACYMTVIFTYQAMPVVGMLMLPKTVAYVAMAVVAYRGFYGRDGIRAETVGASVKTGT